ncbi:hypothetical protein SKAU_G00308840 [Synaphobranchus kaupii]|uniref:Uncharacterized protein n=1 Tax=Synaphobranchus kaupii TaxID=118154 RepID=A0A9Q1IL60_SYNKA|nr:hypothetical protein SKAU_G00308840 [Synaphobranchus kaupii]
MLGPVNANGSTRNLEHLDPAVSQGNEVETCSTCSWTPSSQLSPGSRVIFDMDLSDCYSMDSRLDGSTATVTFSQVTPEASFSEASEMEGLPGSGADPEVISPANTHSPGSPGSRHSQSPTAPGCSPTPPGCSPTPSGCSDTPRSPEKRAEDDEVTQGDEIKKEMTM